MIDTAEAVAPVMDQVDKGNDFVTKSEPIKDLTADQLEGMQDAFHNLQIEDKARKEKDAQESQARIDAMKNYAHLISLIRSSNSGNGNPLAYSFAEGTIAAFDKLIDKKNSEEVAFLDKMRTELPTAKVNSRGAS